MNKNTIISLPWAVPANAADFRRVKVIAGGVALADAAASDRFIGTAGDGDLNTEQADVQLKGVGIHFATVGNSTALATGDEIMGASEGRIARLVPVAGVAQVETATVVAASGATSNGTVALVLTSAAVAGSPLTVTVPVTTASNTATLVAAVLAAGLAANAAVASRFTVTSSAATIILTRRPAMPNVFPPNDETLKLAIPAGLGITAADTSADTTAGVATQIPIGVVVDLRPNDGAAASGDIVRVVYY
jgi:hypothetical protein